jgi:hypothetical protein
MCGMANERYLIRWRKAPTSGSVAGAVWWWSRVTVPQKSKLSMLDDGSNNLLNHNGAILHGERRFPRWQWGLHRHCSLLLHTYEIILWIAYLHCGVSNDRIAPNPIKWSKDLACDHGLKSLASFAYVDGSYNSKKAREESTHKERDKAHNTKNNSTISPKCLSHMRCVLGFLQK